MSLLLDTQIVLWAAAQPSRLSREVRAALEDSANAIHVSAVSIAEMVIKQSIGKLALPIRALDLCAELGFHVLALTGADGQRLAELPLLHRDPFDRLLVAQAIETELTLVTSDEQIMAYPRVSLMKN
jgi:PIN domain nuclease of toxin-antitoxin system